MQKIVFGHASQKFVNKKPRREFSITLQWYISFAPPEGVHTRFSPKSRKGGDIGLLITQLWGLLLDF